MVNTATQPTQRTNHAGHALCNYVTRCVMIYIQHEDGLVRLPELINWYVDTSFPTDIPSTLSKKKRKKDRKKDKRNSSQAEGDGKDSNGPKDLDNPNGVLMFHLWLCVGRLHTGVAVDTFACVFTWCVETCSVFDAMKSSSANAPVCCRA